ncbi:manganese efflux pump MntP [Paenibacillus tarimensis]|uniref:manganese efflux pump MntP n=1 Tax=Paenibacillus tarimensis TaxID=416012 RepID=UPI001F164EF4|nr:manganese efflux pump [Paenibacillus tarimensis]MCF2944190.1 manganese efflux pump MntP family protein [Paenibacillus tarimensis]
MDGAVIGTSVAAGQLMTIVVMAVALGMDAFSLGIGIGLKGIRKLDIVKLSLLIAFFHVVMPLTGMFMGQYVGSLLGGVAVKAGGALLLLLGGHMIYSSLRGDAVQSFDHRTAWGMLLFSLSVSIDSFSVGVSLGMFATDVVTTVLMFGLFGGIMSIMGLLLGQRVSRNLGEYGEACGGIILFAFGILFLI